MSSERNTVFNVAESSGPPHLICNHRQIVYGLSLVAFSRMEFLVNEVKDAVHQGNYQLIAMGNLDSDDRFIRF